MTIKNNYSIPRFGDILVTIYSYNARHWIIFLFLAVMLLIPNHLWSANNYLWDFSREEDVRDWTGAGAIFTYLKESDAIKISAIDDSTDIKAFSVLSPNNLNLHINDNYFLKIKMRLTNSEDSAIFLKFRAKSDDKIISNPFLFTDIKADDEFHTYKINLAEFLSSETIFDQFDINSTLVNRETIEIMSLEIYKPSVVELILQNMHEGFTREEVERLGWINTNNVKAPMFGKMTMPLLLYLSAFIIYISVRLINRNFTIKKAVILSLTSIVFIFALRMDYNWFMIFKKDLNTLSDKDITEKISMLSQSDFYNFILFIKKTIPENKTIKPFAKSDRSDYVRGKYYLLPIKTSDEAEYIWIYNKKYNFDQSTHTLTSGETTVSSVKLAATFRQGAEIYQLIK